MIKVWDIHCIVADEYICRIKYLLIKLPQIWKGVGTVKDDRAANILRIDHKSSFWLRWWWHSGLVYLCYYT